MGASTAGGSSLEGATWQLISATPKSGDQLDATGTGATFAIDQGRLRLNTGCNSGGGTVVVSTRTIDVGGVFTTRMACDETRMALERAVLAALAGTVDYAVDGGTLTITGSGGQLVYTRGAASDSGSDTNAGTTTETSSTEAPKPAEPAPTVAPTTIEPGTPAPEKTVRRTSIPKPPEK